MTASGVDTDIPHGITQSKLLHSLQILLLKVSRALLFLLGWAFGFGLGSSDLVMRVEEERSNGSLPENRRPA